MKLFMLPLALVAAPLSAQSVTPPLSPELQMGARCAALFSLVAADQVRRKPGAGEWPPLGQRGREFFVRIAARAMDEGQLDRAGIQALMRAEAASLQDTAVVRSLRAPCLAMLDATLPAAN